MHPRRHFRITLREHSLDLGPKTLIMGVLNVTPDSFSDGGRFLSYSDAVTRAWRIADEGADILDIGGESTRPGSQGVSSDEELRRVLPVLEAVAGTYPLPISVDTSKAVVARRALELGAELVNDVTALRKSPQIGEEVARSGAGIILMHMRGDPCTMQVIPPSQDILSEIEQWAGEAVERAGSSGISSSKIILDPGIGFGKTANQNLEILRHLGRLAKLSFPLMIGTSRKSFIGTILNRPAGDRIFGSAASVAASIMFGAHIVRVHDVAAMRDVAQIIDSICSERPEE